MARVVDVLGVTLVLAAALAFTAGIHELADRHDLTALYWLLMGGLSLHAGSTLLRPRGPR